jgi:peptidoglycan/LPS O-acetylase OafA/YrhL
MQKEAPAERSERHVKALDGIRAISILWVMAFHFTNADYASGGVLQRFVGAWLQEGWIGVHLFFVLSGFLITGILYDSLHGAHFFRNFYARRTLRIFPLYYAALFVLLALTPLLHLNWHGRWWVWALYLQNLPLSQSDHLSASVAIVHFWTLAVEEQFYLVWPLVVFLVRDIKKLIWLSLGLATFSVVLRWWLPHTGMQIIDVRTLMPCQADSLLIGGAAALGLRTSARLRLLAAGPWLLFASLLALTALVLRQGTFDWRADMPLFTLGLLFLATASAGLILWAMQPTTWLAQTLEWRPMLFIGKYSYGIYVIHFLLAGCIDPLRKVVNAHTHQKILGVLVPAVVVGALSIAMAYASYELFEKRFLLLKRHFEYSKQAKPHWLNLEEPKESR